jgi:hypothetical protein
MRSSSFAKKKNLLSAVYVDKIKFILWKALLVAPNFVFLHMSHYKLVFHETSL